MSVRRLPWCSSCLTLKTPRKNSTSHPLSVPFLCLDQRGVVGDASALELHGGKARLAAHEPVVGCQEQVLPKPRV